jgi:hypothetical protein
MKKLLYNENGTQNNSLSNIIRDWNTNLQIALGNGQNTDRLKQERNALEKARSKYNDPEDVVLTGHSQAGYFFPMISKPTDKVITYNKASLGEPVKKNETLYKTSNDITSLLNLGSKHSKLISLNPFQDVIDAHNIENLKNKNIRI